MLGIIIEQPGDHSKPDGKARAEQPRGQPLRRAGDRGDHDRPMAQRDTAVVTFPDAEPAFVLARHEHAGRDCFRVRCH